MSSSTVKPEKKRVRLHSVDSLRKRCRQNWDEQSFAKSGDLFLADRSRIRSRPMDSTMETDHSRATRQSDATAHEQPRKVFCFQPHFLRRLATSGSTFGETHAAPLRFRVLAPNRRCFGDCRSLGNWMNGIVLPTGPHFDLDSLWLEPGASATLPREWRQVRHMPPQVLARLIFVFSTDYAARVDSCVTDCSALRVRHHKHRQFGKSTRDTIRTQQVPAEWESWLKLKDFSQPSWTDIKGVYSHLRPVPRVVPPIRVLNNSCSHIVLCRRRGTGGISHPRVARAVPRWCTTRKASTQIDNLIEGKWNSVGLPEAVITTLTFMGAFTSSTVAVIQRSSSTRTRF